MTSSFSIRRALNTDIADIARLAMQLGPDIDADAIVKRLPRLLDMPTHAVFVTATDEGVTGFAAVEHRILLQFGERIELVALVVDVDARRQGAGSGLMAASEAWARRRGVEEVVARASVSHDASHPFYEHLGYTQHNTQHVYSRALIR